LHAIIKRPFSDAPAFAFKVVDCQIDQLGCGIVSWKAASAFCGVDDFAHRWLA
jgi:hypothetical protein